MLPVRLCYRRQLKWRSTSESAAEFLILQLASEEGLTGASEVTVKPAWTGTTMTDLVGTLEKVLLPALSAIDISDDSLFADVCDCASGHRSAKVLLEMARADLLAQACGTPLWKLWGGESRVPLTWIVSRQSPEEMAGEAVEYVSKYGFSTLKVKGGQGLRTDLAALDAIRDAVGDAVTLYVDCNRGYDRREVSLLQGEAAARNVVAIEDPCDLEKDANFTELQTASQMPFIVDWACASAKDVADFARLGARAVSVKPGRVGLAEAQAMISAAATGKCKVVIGYFGESELGSIFGLQIASTCRSLQLVPPELSLFLMMSDSLLLSPLEVRAGAVDLSDVAGLNGLIDWNKARDLSEKY